MSALKRESARPIIGDAFWVIAGGGLPLLLALASIPALMRTLGVEGFGILVLAWTALGYFSLFDLGLGRALTRLIAGQDLANDPPLLRRSVWTALAALFFLGVLAAALFVPLIPWLTRSFLNLTTQAQVETRNAFLLLAFGFPLVTLGSGLLGFLEAFRKFRLIGAVRLITGSLNYLAPLAVALMTESLGFVVATVVGVRGFLTVALLAACLKTAPSLRAPPEVDWRLLKPMLAFGGWLTLSSVAVPVILYLDRFVMGAFVPMSSFAYYVTPQEIVTRLWIIPAAFTSILFPGFVSASSWSKSEAADLLRRGLASVFLITFPLALLLCTFSFELLSLWIGPDFAENSALVLSWFAVGILINGGAQVLSTFVQGLGRPDLTAKLHLLEIPIYMLMLWWLVPQFGIVGAAYAWVGRILLDAIALLGFSWLLAADTRRLGVGILLTSIAAVGLSAAGASAVAFSWKAVLFALSIVVMAILGWTRLLAEPDRRFFRQALSSLRNPGRDQEIRK